MRKLIVGIVLAVFWVPGALSEGMDIGEFVGHWEVDFDRTMEEVKKSPEYNPEDAEKLPKIVKRMMQRMKIRIEPDNVVYWMGKRQEAFPFTVTAASDTTVTANTEQHGKTATFVLTLVEGRYMNLKSSTSDDLDYYIWKPATEAGNAGTMSDAEVVVETLKEGLSQ